MCVRVRVCLDPHLSREEKITQRTQSSQRSGEETEKNKAAEGSLDSATRRAQLRRRRKNRVAPLGMTHGPSAWTRVGRRGRKLVH
jgi:hypothetical protein